MADFAGTLTSVTEGAGSAANILIWIIVGVAGLALVLALIFALWWRKKRYNLDVEIKLTRGDGRITLGEWGRGFYDAKRGVVMIKRPGAKRGVPMKIFDIRKYMQGTRLITVIQVGPEDFRPVLNDSWTKHFEEVIDKTKPRMDGMGNSIVDEEGNQLYNTTQIGEAIINIKTETGKNKAWKVAWEEAAKNAYTIKSFLREHSVALSVSIVVICCFVGFAILWTKLSSMC